MQPTPPPRPLSPVLCACVLVVNDRGQILLVKRKLGTGVSMPGGKADPGEDVRIGAARELLEETGLRADPASLVRLFDGICASELDHDYLTTTFFAPRWEGEIGTGEVEMQPYWGSWKELIEGSPFEHYNRAMAWEGFVPYLNQGQWTQQKDRWLAALTDDVALR